MISDQLRTWNTYIRFSIATQLPAMATDTFMCVLSLYVVSLLSLSLEVFAQRSCSPGMFCPIGANCTSNTNLCVIHCPVGPNHVPWTDSTLDPSGRVQQGNHLTGNCERSKLYHGARLH